MASRCTTHRVIFDFEATHVGQLSVAQDDLLRLEEEDNGDGWSEVVRVADGAAGLVPTAYIEEEGDTDHLESKITAIDAANKSARGWRTTGSRYLGRSRYWSNGGSDHRRSPSRDQ